MTLQTDFNYFITRFSGEYASQYPVRRPAYPTELFDWLAASAPDREHAWDAGAGTGELAVALGELLPQIAERWPEADGGPVPISWPLFGRATRLP